MKTVSILIPVYNETDVLKLLYDRLKYLMDNSTSYKWEILFVNDGSKDDSLLIIRNLRNVDQRVNFVDLSRNYGKEIAMLAGFDYVIGDCVVIMDADLQDPPELIPQMLQYWEEGYDDVYAKRRKRDGESFLKKMTSKLYYRILQKTTKIELQVDTGDFRLLDRKCISALKQIRESQRYTKGIFSWIGFKKKELLFDRDIRAAGKTKWNYWSLIGLAIEGVTSFTISPLRISSILGLIVSVFSFIYMCYVFGKALLYGDPVQGYPSLIVIILFLGGVQLLSLGILGEYVGRIFYETKRRPPYFVREYNGEYQMKKNN
ncbi:glycosyltransferase family 2 protein [Parabacteroides bouchesdurhonensis]|uniref:glycosyltransferase family 2 protein n=1 Tax=Parabacteroides bouchesdurhonensis TaxID=1936995 RepID=UPI000C85197F|nr:glycosyltransferase family 2 protein [Parabacteroides bouchesdurhonensis]